METVYVTKDAGASNLNDGSNATTEAWETAIYGFANMGASNTLKFGTGAYDITRSTFVTPIPNGTSEAYTIITDNADGVVTFNHPGSGSLGLIGFDGASPRKEYIRLIATSPRNIVFDGENQSAPGAGIYAGGGAPASSCPHFIEFINLEVKGFQDSGFLTGHSEDITIDGCWVSDNGTYDPARSTPGDHGIYGVGARMIIKNCTVYDNFGWGLHIYSTSAPNYAGREIYNNRIYNNGNGNGTTQVGGSGILVNSGAATIYNNVCFKNKSYGIDVWRTSAATIFHNTVHENSGGGIKAGLSSGSGTNNLQIKNNISIGNAGTQIQILGSCSNAVVSWNIASGTVSDSGSGTIASNNTDDAVAADEWTDPTNATLASRDYSLKTGADSIGTTTTNEVPNVGVTTDIAGTARPQGSFVDQGAYEFGTTPPPDAPALAHSSPYTVVANVYTGSLLTLSDGDSNTLTVAMVGEYMTIKTTPTANVTVTSP